MELEPVGSATNLMVAPNEVRSNFSLSLSLKKSALGFRDLFAAGRSQVAWRS